MGNLISARAAPVRGGATGAQTVAYTDAQKFCAQRVDGLHPIVVNTQERDIYQSSFGGGFNQYGGSVGGSPMAARAVNVRFRVGQYAPVAGRSVVLRGEEKAPR